MSDRLIRESDAIKLADYHVTDDDDRMTLKHAIRALPAATVGVKPLVWEDFDGFGAKSQAFGRANYLVSFWKSRQQFEVVESYPGYQGDAIGKGFYPTLDAAKAAAQADYAARILAALDTPAQPALAEALAVPEDGFAALIRDAIAEAEKAEAALAKAMTALVEHNDLLRSAIQIAKREGVEGQIGTTNWDAYYNRVAVVLKRHNERVNAARAFLAKHGEQK